MIYIFLAEGFEEIEALTTVDILRRADLSVAVVGVGAKIVTGSHGIAVYCDVLDCEIFPTDDCKAIILPGGMPGTLNLEKSKTVSDFIDYAAKENITIAAICAAPSILGHKGLLRGRDAVCYKGFEEQLIGANVKSDNVCISDNIITAYGAGNALQFAFTIVELFCGSGKRHSLEAALLCDR